MSPLIQTGRPRLSRRHLLRGMLAGAPVALALPTLEAMLGEGARASGSDLGPIFGLFFWGGGLPWHASHGLSGTDDWTPAATGPGYSPSVLLGPLGAHLPSVVTGLTPYTEIPSSPDGQSDGHMRGFMVSTTSDRPRSEGFDHPSHTLTALRATLDQVVAKDDRFYADFPSPYRSLELGVSTARFHDYGHWNNISYNGPDSINPATTDPTRLYEMIFGISTGDAEAARRAALLDVVLEDARDLKRRVGADDRHRVDDHMEHLYEVQRRLELGNITCENPGAPGSSGDLYTQNGIIAELLALGLSCNITRVFSYMLTSPATTHVFSEVGTSTDNHTVCHSGDWSTVYNSIYRQMLCFGSLMDHLAAHVDPTGATLMDRALIYGCSEYGEGYQHSVAEMPVVLAGGANGRLVRGVHVREAGGNMARAHLTLLQALGLEYDSYGFSGSETSSPYTELLA